MKLSIVFLIVIFTLLNASAELRVRRSNYTAPVFLDGLGLPPAPEPAIIDPYRLINGTTNLVTKQWTSFSGVVTQVHPGEGIRVIGRFSGQQAGNDDYFVVNFPYAVAEGDRIGDGKSIYKALPAGIYEYSTAKGSTRSIHKLDYGIVWTPPPPTPEQIAAMKARAAAAKQAANDKALDYNQALADKGDAYGLLRMGERYRDGEGVDKDIPTARGYLERAKAAGSEKAAKALEELNAK